MKNAIWMACGFLCLVSAPTVIGAEVDRKFSERFDVRPGVRLELEHQDGRVEVKSWEADAIQVDVIYRVNFKRVGLGRDPDLEVSFDQRDDVVRVVGREGTVGGIGYFSKDEIEYVYRIQAPDYVELDIVGDDGDVEIEDWKGNISLRNDDGDLRLSDIQAERVEVRVEDGDIEIDGLEGDLTLDADDGDIRIRNCRGDQIRIDAEDGRVRLDGCEGSFEISTDDGDIDLEDIRASGLDLRTADGSIDVVIEASLGDLAMEVRTEDGDVDVELGADVSASFDLSADDGDIRVDADAKALRTDEHRSTGQLGDGSGTLRISTDSGRVTLRQ